MILRNNSTGLSRFDWLIISWIKQDEMGYLRLTIPVQSNVKRIRAETTLVKVTNGEVLPLAICKVLQKRSTAGF